MINLNNFIHFFPAFPQAPQQVSTAPLKCADSQSKNAVWKDRHHDKRYNKGQTTCRKFLAALQPEKNGQALRNLNTSFAITTPSHYQFIHRLPLASLRRQIHKNTTTSGGCKIPVSLNKIISVDLTPSLIITHKSNLLFFVSYSFLLPGCCACSTPTTLFVNQILPAS